MSIFFLILFTLISAFFSASETTLFSLSSMQVRSYRKSADKRKQLIARLLKSPLELLVTILMVNVLVNILIQNVVSNIFGLYSSILLTVGIPLLITLIFGEVVPKSMALVNNTRLAPILAPTIAFFRYILGPIRILLTWLTRHIAQVGFLFFKKESGISSEELQYILKSSEKSGILQQHETFLMRGYLKIQNTSIKEIMRPREEIIFYNTEDSLDTLSSLLVDQEVSHLPVCTKGLQGIKGIITTQTFFLYKEDIYAKKSVESFLKKPFFAPESMKAIHLLKLLNVKEEPLTLVVDEYGSISGLITKEDLIEVVVGEIADRRDAVIRYTKSGKSTIIASGKLELFEFNHIFDANLISEANMATLGGWLIEKLGSIPPPGTKYQAEGFLFHVLAADPNRIRRVYVKKLQEKPGDN